MNRIKALPTDVVSKIAAGQVIERPASVVKELIENSIDADATQITVEVEDAGLRKIRVVDNGSGISKEDLAIAPLPHTTSKIYNSEDISRLKTLGFRGEALSSISSMGELIIKSRQSKYGYSISIKKGKVGKMTPTGMQKGTIVEVHNLFSSIPARKQHLNSHANEQKYISDIVTQTALAYPQITFELVNNKQQVLNFLSQTQLERIEMVLGKTVAQGLIPIHQDVNGIRIHGFIGAPQSAIKQKWRQYLFVNKRPVHSELISSYIKTLFGTLLDPRLNPTFIIFIQTPPDFVDVNIHPRKEEVHFHTQSIILELLESAISPQLQQKNLTYQFSLQQTMSKKTAFVIKDAVSKWSVKPQKRVNNTVIQVDKTFLITQTHTNLLIIDQHAAHERILFEQFKKNMEAQSKKAVVTKLASPAVIHLPMKEFQLFTEQTDVFDQLGFKFKIMNNTISVTGIPNQLTEHNLQQLFGEVLSEIYDNISSIDSLTQRTLSYLACRSAIKAGDELTQDEGSRLINKLFTTKTHYTCPHGRPVLIEIPLSQLHIAFRRK